MQILMFELKAFIILIFFSRFSFSACMCKCVCMCVVFAKSSARLNCKFITGISSMLQRNCCSVAFFFRLLILRVTGRANRKKMSRDSLWHQIHIQIIIIIHLMWRMKEMEKKRWEIVVIELSIETNKRTFAIIACA